MQKQAASQPRYAAQRLREGVIARNAITQKLYILVPHQEFRGSFFDPTQVGAVMQLFHRRADAALGSETASQEEGP